MYPSIMQFGYLYSRKDDRLAVCFEALVLSFAPIMAWDDPLGERITPLVKGTEFTRPMDVISLTFYIGRRAEVFRQKKGGRVKGRESGHLRSQEDDLNTESG